MKDLKKQLQQLPKLPGVYLFRDQEGKLLYVGKANSLFDRVSSYFHKPSLLGPKTQKLVSLVKHLDHINTESELEALLLEADLIKRHKPPYNIQWKDDKFYKYIEIKNQRSKNKDKKVWPNVTTSRRTDDPSAYYFGPFPQGKTVNEVLKTLRRIFPWCKYTHAPLNNRPCLYYHLGLCPGICAGAITINDYSKIIANLVRLLQGGKVKILKEWQKEMQELSRLNRFEEAGKIKDKLNQLSYILQKFRSPSDFLQNPNLLEDQALAEIKSLLGVLNLPPTIKKGFRIEAYDISNIQGKLAVGSMVVFTNGSKDQREYKRFKIKTIRGINDPAMMAEIIKRRFGNNWTLPNLILIDGGPTQLSAVLSQIPQALKIPTIALAKKFEEIYQPQVYGFQKLLLPKDTPAINLLRRIRDESHRFAVQYHRHLRSKALGDKV